MGDSCALFGSEFPGVSSYDPPDRKLLYSKGAIEIAARKLSDCVRGSASVVRGMVRCAMCPEPYRVKVSICESLLLQLLPDLKTMGRTREVIWTEQALCLLGGTLEILSMCRDG